MNGGLIPIAVALIALVGTLVGALLAHRRWRADRRSPFDDERRATYQQVWEKAEALNLDLRTGELDSERRRERLTELNRFMLQSGPHLEEDDRLLVREYVEAVSAFLAVLDRPEAAHARVPVGQTDAVPPEVLERVRDLGDAQKQATQLRSAVLDRIQAVLRG